jgi:hypothetical protein
MPRATTIPAKKKPAAKKTRATRPVGTSYKDFDLKLTQLMKLTAKERALIERELAKWKEFEASLLALRQQIEELEQNKRRVLRHK